MFIRPIKILSSLCITVYTFSVTFILIHLSDDETACKAFQVCRELQWEGLTQWMHLGRPSAVSCAALSEALLEWHLPTSNEGAQVWLSTLSVSGSHTPTWQELLQPVGTYSHHCGYYWFHWPEVEVTISPLFRKKNYVNYDHRWAT